MLSDWARSEKGQSLVELALTAPFLLLILLGAVDLGRVFYYQVTITNAAREGVRAASVYTNDDSAVRIAARDEVSTTVPLPDPAIVINPSPIRSSGEPVTVTVSYSFTALTPVIDTLLGNRPIRIAGWASTVVQ